MKKILSSILLLLMSASFAFADISPGNSKIKPKPKPTGAQEPEKVISGKMYIRVRSDAKEPILTINRSTLNRLRAAIDEADDAQQQALATSDERYFNFSRAQTIVSGLFFSLAFVFGGVWMFRAKGKSPKLAMSLIALAVLSASAGVAFANTPPSYVVSLTSRIFSQSTYAYGWAEGNIKIKIVDDDSDRYDVSLQIPDVEKNTRDE